MDVIECLGDLPEEEVNPDNFKIQSLQKPEFV